MKAKPVKLVEGEGYVPCSVKDATHVILDVPSPLSYRVIPVILSGPRRETPCWTWNGDVDKPTLKPSIKTWTADCMCHSFVTDGMIRFLGDCTHENKNKTVPLNEVED